MKLVLGAVLLAACGHPAPHPELALPVHSASAPAIAVDAPAVLIDAPAVPDAAPPDTSADPDTSYYDHESLGPLHTGMTDRDAIAALGKPSKRSKPWNEPATGSWVTTWTWPDATVDLAGDHAQGPWTARGVSIGGASTFATRRGIHLGSTRAEVERTYPRAGWPQQQPDRYLVGSPYGGMLFFFADDKVVGISIACSRSDRSRSDHLAGFQLKPPRSGPGSPR